MSGPAGDDKSEAEGGGPQPRQVLAVVLVFFVLVSIATLIFVFAGDRGNTSIGLIAAIAAVASALLKVAVTWNQIREMVSHYRRPVVALGIVAVLVVTTGVSAGIYYLFRTPEVSVLAQSVQVDGIDDTADLAPGRPAVLTFNKLPEKRNLILGLSLDDYIQSGDCVTAPHLVLAPRIGQIERPAVVISDPGTNYRSSRPATVSLDAVPAELKIRVTLEAPAGCRLRLVVTEASFYG